MWVCVAVWGEECSVKPVWTVAEALKAWKGAVESVVHRAGADGGVGSVWVLG